VPLSLKPVRIIDARKLIHDLLGFALTNLKIL
jgi:hypothetical protein